MASPQIEDGYTKIANATMEALAKIRIPGEARQVLDVIFRQTYGWNETEAGISLQEFQERTGLPKPTVCKAIAKLRLLNIITQKGKASNTTYGFQKDFELWKPLPKKVIKDFLPKKAINLTQKGNKPLPKKVIPLIYKKKSYKKRKTYPVDTDPYKLSELLFSLILENNPHSRLHACQNGDKESTIQRWAKDIDLLIRKDRQQSLIVEEVIRFTANDDFWGPNVQSGAKLREKWDTLVAQKNRKGVSTSAASKSNVANEEPVAMQDTAGRPLPKLSTQRTAEGRI